MDQTKQAVELGSTPKGKVMLAKLHERTGLYFAYFRDGGELPAELRGNFTSIETLKGKVVAYLSRLQIQNVEKAPVPEVIQNKKSEKVIVAQKEKKMTHKESVESPGALMKKRLSGTGVEFLGEEKTEIESMSVQTGV